jgi:hypothetical protein
LLACLPEDVRLVASICLPSTLPISEALGLQEKHLNFASGQIAAALLPVNNQESIREVPIGYLGDDFKRCPTGDPERFEFEIKTRPEFGRKESTCRDDRDINQHFSARRPKRWASTTRASAGTPCAGRRLPI